MDGFGTWTQRPLSAFTGNCHRPGNYCGALDCSGDSASFAAISWPDAFGTEQHCDQLWRFIARAWSGEPAHRVNVGRNVDIFEKAFVVARWNFNPGRDLECSGALSKRDSVRRHLLWSMDGLFQTKMLPKRRENSSGRLCHRRYIVAVLENHRRFARIQHVVKNRI